MVFWDMVKKGGHTEEEIEDEVEYTLIIKSYNN